MPFQQTANPSGMKFIEPVYSHSMVYIPNVYNELEEVKNRAKEHANRLLDKLDSLAASNVQKLSA